MICLPCKMSETADIFKMYVCNSLKMLSLQSHEVASSLTIHEQQLAYVWQFFLKNKHKSASHSISFSSTLHLVHFLKTSFTLKINNQLTLASKNPVLINSKTAQAVSHIKDI